MPTKPPSEGERFLRLGAELVVPDIVPSTWGCGLQRNVLHGEVIDIARRLIDAAIAEAEHSLQRHRPSLTVGKDDFSFSEMASRNKERFDLRLRNDEAMSFVRNHILSDRRVSKILWKAIGNDTADVDIDIQTFVSSEIDFDVSVVYSRPGACAQLWHADGDHQRGAPDAIRGREARPYAMCLFVPLIDLDKTVGYTQFWPGSHRYRDLVGFGPVAELTNATFDGICSAGDGVWYDYRLMHRGMPNSSVNILRPILQVIFKKRWYVERSNYGSESIAPPGEIDARR